MINTIKKDLLVAASQETCFNVFTQQMGGWWPKAYHVGQCQMTETVVEPSPNGRWYSKHADGSEINIGHVLTWDPYGLLILNWQIDGNFQYNPAITTEVEVQFIAEGPRTTRIKFEHKHLERLAGGTKVIEGMDEGWGTILNLYKGTTEGHYRASIFVNSTTEQALAAIADVSGWWAKDFTGSAKYPGDRFTVRFGKTRVDFEIAGTSPHEAIWQVTDCILPWLKDQKEWNGTRVIWQANPDSDKTRIDMTHIGLAPHIECYAGCEEGWDRHVKGSLQHFIDSGKGEPK